MTNMLDRMADLERVLEAAAELSGNLARAQIWLDLPLLEYGNRSARQMVDAGRADVVLAHIGQLQSGSSCQAGPVQLRSFSIIGDARWSSGAVRLSARSR